MMTPQSEGVAVTGRATMHQLVTGNLRRWAGVRTTMPVVATPPWAVEFPTGPAAAQQPLAVGTATGPGPTTQLSAGAFSTLPAVRVGLSREASTIRQTVVEV